MTPCLGNANITTSAAMNSFQPKCAVCGLEAAQFSSQTIGLVLQLVHMEPVFLQVLLGPVTILKAFQFTLQSAVGSVHLGQLKVSKHLCK